MNQIFILTSLLILITSIMWFYLNGDESIKEIGKFQFQQQLELNI